MAPPPCETSLGCAKGHWTKEVRLQSHEEKLIELFWASRQTGGLLTEAEKASPIVRSAFDWMSRYAAEYDRQTLIEAVTLASLKG